MPTVCLSMIVKDEAAVIERCLDSVRPLIAAAVIVDTGSRDDTPAIARAWLDRHGMAGQVVERPWVDFATNRNEALEHARPYGDWLLFVDADDTLAFGPDFVSPALEHDAYEIEIRDGGTIYARTMLVRASLPWTWRGVLHEFIACEEPASTARLDGVWLHRQHDGARRRSADTYRHDASILAAVLPLETDPFMRARYTFYLAQSLFDCGDLGAAREAYLRRATLGFWDEEVFIALYRAAKITEQLGEPPEAVIGAYCRAAEASPRRAEAWHAAARFCRETGRNEEGYEYARRGVAITRPEQGLFVETWVYDYGLLDELAVNGYWAGAHRACLDACLTLLGSRLLPAEHVSRVTANARFAADRLAEGELPPRRLGEHAGEGFLDQHRLGPARSLHARIDGAPLVMIAILAKQKERFLPLYLACIEALDYPKSSIVLHVRTNNNTDATEAILRAWLARVGHAYAAVEFDAGDLPVPVERFGVHEWNPVRFAVLGALRDASLRRALAHGCAWYFVADVDNFVRPCTLRELVATGLPIVGPLLRVADPAGLYSNFHASIDENGYYAECEPYEWILNRWVRGLIEVPVIHTTYLVRCDVIPTIGYQDGSGRFEYVIFSHAARRAGIPQYIDNRQVYGYITFDEDSPLHAAGGLERVRALLAAECAPPAGTPA